MLVDKDFKEVKGTHKSYILAMDTNEGMLYQKDQTRWISDINEADRAPLTLLTEFFDDSKYTIIEETVTRNIVKPTIEINPVNNYRGDTTKRTITEKIDIT